MAEQVVDEARAEERVADQRRATEGKQDTLWVHSNRRDNRVVIWEVDPRHPGGEAFVGGDGADMVARTPEIDRLLREGQLVEIAEPPEGRKKPMILPVYVASEQATQPGQPIALGRAMDPELVPAGAMKAVEQQQKDAGSEVPVPRGTIVPPPETPERTSNARR